MTEAIDPVTSALTGHLSFHLLLAGILTWPISLGLLALYARAVRHSMRSRAHAAAPAVSTHSADAAEAGARADARRAEAPGATANDLTAAPNRAEADALSARVLAGPRHAAVVYGVAGIAYAVVMATAELLSHQVEILPVRFLFLFWIFIWPVVPAIGMVGAPTRRIKVAATIAYFAGLTIIGGIGIARSPLLTWGQVFYAWILYNLPPTILLLAYLSRRIRAVGPLVLTFLVLALIGSDIALAITASQDRYLRGVIGLTSAIGVGGTGAFIAVMVAGFVAFAIVGWVALAWIGRRYQAKKISDESVAVDALWVLFTIVHSMNLVFGRPLWALAGAAAFAVYKLCARVGFAWWARRDGTGRRIPTLLALRSFSIGGDSERLFDAIGRHWRRAGSIQMIAGVDLTSQTVEPHEFLDFVSGRLSRRFIDGRDALDRRMLERDVAPDRDLRFRVNEFFCYDDTWKMVLSSLVRDSDAVLMDLRGFSRQNAGCMFELGELVHLVPLDRVVFVIDGRTDERLLAETLGDRRITLFRLTRLRGGQLRQLLRAITAAAVRGTAVHA
jgi:hypothetical protein